MRLVSIVMPAYNAEATIGLALGSIINQEADVAVEVIVVDDGSADRTPEIAESYDAVRVLRQANAGPAVARNRGAAQATGDVVVFIDSDCEASPGWLAEMLAPFADPSVTAVKGAYRTRQTALTARFVQLEYEDKYDRMASREHIDFVDTYSAAFRRDAFVASGGYSAAFDLPSAEDVDLSYRMASAGALMVFRPQAIVYHRHPDRLGAYLRKKARFASWRVLAVRRNPGKAISDSHTPQLMKVQALAAPAIPILAAATPFAPAAGIAAAALAGAFAASTVPFTAKAYRKDRAVGLASPVLLYLRGVAQGIGLVSGVIRVAFSAEASRSEAVAAPADRRTA